jgi:plasmid stabilization system protein ParE
MTPQVVLSAKARADLQAIEDYIAEQSGPMRADMVLSRIEETMRVLAFMPGILRVVDGRRDLPAVLGTI